MPIRPLLASLPFAALISLPAPAQGVLTLQKSYHVGGFSGDIGVPSGALTLSSGVGEVTLAGNGTLAGYLDRLESDPLGTTLTPGDPFGGVYEVRTDGELILDFDPLHPGTDTIAAWMDTAGSVFHSARFAANEEAVELIAIEHASGMSTAALNGTYYVVAQGLEFGGGTWNTYAFWGSIVFDGLGTATYTGTNQNASPTGATTTPATGTFPYSVAADGTLQLNGSRGAVSGDGELLFVVEPQTTSGFVGLSIAVRLGSAYDLQQLAGVFSLTGERFTLGTGPALPRTNSDYDEMQLFGLGPTSGTWINTGVAVEGTAAGLTQNPPSSGGPCTLTAAGMLTLNEPAGTIELGVSANGRYAVGRRPGNATNQMFAMRQCGSAFVYGTATPGTGGNPPSLGMHTFPTLPNNDWRLRVGNAIGGGIGIVGVSLAPAPGVPALGGLIWIDPTAAYLPVLLLGGAAGAAGAGSGEVHVILPNNPSVDGVPLFAQALILDPAAPAGFSMSPGFEAHACR